MEQQGRAESLSPGRCFLLQTVPSAPSDRTCTLWPNGAAPGSAMKPCRHPGISGSHRPSLGLLLPGCVPHWSFWGCGSVFTPARCCCGCRHPLFRLRRQISAGLEASRALGLSLWGPAASAGSWAEHNFHSAKWHGLNSASFWALASHPTGTESAENWQKDAIWTQSAHWAFSAPSSLSILCLLGLGVGGNTRWEVGGTCAKWDPLGTHCECLSKHDGDPRGDSRWASGLWAQGLSLPPCGPAQIPPRSQGSLSPRNRLYLQLLSFLASPAKTILS